MLTPTIATSSRSKLISVRKYQKELSNLRYAPITTEGSYYSDRPAIDAGRHLPGIAHHEVGIPTRPDIDPKQHPVCVSVRHLR